MRVSLPLGLVFGLLLGTQLCGQQWVTVPREFTRIPGNTAMSLPARWSRGVMQVILDQEALGSVEGESITHLRMRRPAFPEDGDYGPRQVTMTVRMGPSPRRARFISGVLDDNRPEDGLVTVFGPAQVSIPASSPNRESSVGDPLFTLDFDQPFVVGFESGRGLVVEIETGAQGQAPDVDAGNWVDGVWRSEAEGRGLAIVLGHSCGTTLGAESALLQTGSPNADPRYGEAVNLQITGAPANAAVVVIVRSDGRHDEDIVSFEGLGHGLANRGLPNCRLWMFGPGGFGAQEVDPFSVRYDGDQEIVGTTSAGGTFLSPLTIEAVPGADALGRAVTIQAFVTSASGQALATNGLVLFMGQTPTRNLVSTIFVPEDMEASLWRPRFGGAPIFEFRFQ